MGTMERLGGAGRERVRCVGAAARRGEGDGRGGSYLRRL
jgi:hypothetical protein